MISYMYHIARKLDNGTSSSFCHFLMAEAGPGGVCRGAVAWGCLEPRGPGEQIDAASVSQKHPNVE